MAGENPRRGGRIEPAVSSSGAKYRSGCRGKGMLDLGSIVHRRQAAGKVAPRLTAPEAGHGHGSTSLGLSLSADSGVSGGTRPDACALRLDRYMLASGFWYTSGAFWAGAGVAAVLLAGLLGVVAAYSQRPALLVYELLSAEPLLRVSGSHGSDLQISYQDQIIADPQLLIVQLANQGGKDIPSFSFDADRPLVLDLNAQIISVLRNASALGSDLAQLTVKGSLLKVGPNLIRRGDVIELVILASGSGARLVLVDNPLIDVKVRALSRRTTESIRRPEYLRQYDELLPGASDRIMRMVEEQRRYQERTTRVRLVTRLSAFLVLSIILLTSARRAGRSRVRRRAGKFQNSVELIGGQPSVAALEATLPAGALFGRNPNGVLRALYQELCRFAHGHPGHTNADIWKSNGPVFVPEAFTQLWRDFRDTFLACSILLKLAHPALERPPALPEVAAHAGAPWHEIATSAVSAYLPEG